jgi:glycosyltransferase A (GT-A) superfamily protein (DUF2064 family)
MNPDHIVIFADTPESAAAKSELGPIIGVRKTGHLYRAMLFDTLAVCLAMPRADVSVYFHPANALTQFHQLLELFGREEESRSIATKASKLSFIPQNGQSRTERIDAVIEQSLKNDHKRVILVDSACPEINMTLLKAGLLLLKENDVVLGPSFDGKFYMLGMAKSFSSAFNGLSGEEPDLFARFKANLKNGGAIIQELEISYMVNTAAELNQLIDDIDRWRKIGDSRTALHSERFLMTLG